MEKMFREPIAYFSLHASVAVLGCAIALVAVGSCALGFGQLLVALVVGMPRSPSMGRTV